MSKIEGQGPYYIPSAEELSSLRDRRSRQDNPRKDEGDKKDSYKLPADVVDISEEARHKLERDSREYDEEFDS